METVSKSCRTKSWPTPQDYNEAIQNPQVNLRDPSLRNSVAASSSLGLPRPVSGAFASVYQMNTAEKSWAIRCFLRNVQDQGYRYREIARQIADAKLRCLVDFDFQQEGVRVNDLWFPILKMEWVRGTTLERYIEENLQNRSKLVELQSEFLKVCNDLGQARICHGDLQHGNILIQEDGALRLVDYDGMYVPSMHGMHSNELGHRNYQHPARGAEHFGPTLDNFSMWVIYTSLSAILEDPSIYTRLGGGNDCLLFRKQDFDDIDGSVAFATLDQMSESVRCLSNSLKWLIRSKPLTSLPPGEKAPEGILVLTHRSVEAAQGDQPWYASALQNNNVDPRHRNSEERSASALRGLNWQDVLVPGHRKVPSRTKTGFGSSSIDSARTGTGSVWSRVESELRSSSVPRKLVRSRRPAAYEGEKLLLWDSWMMFLCFCSIQDWSKIGLGACAVSILVFIIQWLLNVERNLLIRGIPTTATITKSISDDSYGQKVFTLTYKFEVSNEMYTNSLKCSEEVYSTMSDGEQVTVLYSEKTPNRSVIYKLSRYRVRKE